MGSPIRTTEKTSSMCESEGAIQPLVQSAPIDRAGTGVVDADEPMKRAVGVLRDDTEAPLRRFILQWY